MKSIILIITLSIFFSACIAQTKTIEGITYDTYGFFNGEDVKNPDVKYRASFGSVFWGLFGFELFFVPTIYFFGFSLYEPVCLKKGHVKGELCK